MYCANCGWKLDDSALVCPNCGVQTENEVLQTDVITPSGGEKIDYSKEFDKLKSVAVESAGKALVGAQKVAGQISQKVEEKKTEIKRQQEEERRRQQELLLQQKKQQEEERKRLEKKKAEGTAYMSTTELWSWLKQSAKRQMFYTEEVSELSEPEFIEKISEKMEANGVPATVEMRNIQWDRSSVNRTSYFIKPHTSAVNPLTCLVQFNHVGKFTFVEEKTFITPPDLPKVPDKPWELDATAKAMAVLVVYGILAGILGLILLTLESDIALPILIAGIAVTAIGYYFSSKNKAILEHNAECARQEKAWADAWNNWQNSIFLHSFQEDINGQLSRIYDSVFECIKQVSSEEFTATKVVEQEESSKMNELEELIARRKEEYR